MPMSVLRSFLAAFLAVSTAACTAEAPRALSVADSAGVRITLNHDEPTIFALVAAAPTLSLGGANAQGATQFFRIQNIYVDARHRLWVADGQSRELRIFGPNGSHLKTRGGRGEGPGEFVAIRLLGGRSGDTVFVADDANGRISVYGPEGDLVRTQQIQSGDHPTPRLFDVFPDGSFLGQVPRILMASTLKPGQILGDSVDLVRVGVDAREWQRYGGALGPLWIWTGRNQVPVPFTANASFDVEGDKVHLAAGPAFRIRVFEAGRLLELYGMDRPARRVGAADVTAYRQMTEKYLPKEQQAEYMAALDHEARPSELPAYSRLIISAGAYVWAQRYEADLSAPPAWDVFDRNRRFVGQVKTPANLIVMAITDNAVVGVWRDDAGVEYVQSYPFARQ